MNSTLKCTPLPVSMRHSALVVSLTAAMSLGMVAHVHTATPAPSEAKAGTPNEASVAADDKSTKKCRSDLRVFDAQMQKDGYWLRGAGYGDGYGYGYGYPMGG